MLSAMVGKGGSGKSLNAVGLIIQELEKGRRVVASIRGLDKDELHSRFPNTSAGELVVLQPETDAFIMPSNWPFVDNHGTVVPGLLICPGDLVIIDEASIKWGTDRMNKIPQEILTFLVTSRQYVDDKGFSTDVYWICQDLTQLNAKVRNILHNTLVFKSLRHFGLNKRYRVTAFDGSKINKGTKLSSRTESQNTKLFGVYESFIGGGAAQVQQVDKRATAISPSLIMTLVFGVAAIGLGIFWLPGYFDPICRRTPEAMIANDDGSAMLMIKGKVHANAKYSSGKRGNFVRLNRCKWRVGGPNGVFQRAN